MGADFGKLLCNNKYSPSTMFIGDSLTRENTQKTAEYNMTADDINEANKSLNDLESQKASLKQYLEQYPNDPMAINMLDDIELQIATYQEQVEDDEISLRSLSTALKFNEGWSKSLES